MPVNDYLKRFHAVLDHIDRDPGDDLSLEVLCARAGFSKYHFQRQFVATLGLSAHEYVQAVRLKRASFQLAFRRHMPVVDIALESGYESHEAFSRVFRRQVGQSPTGFRAAPVWEPWHRLFSRLRQTRSAVMNLRAIPAVSVVDFPETPVALLSHRGDPARLGDTIRLFIDWRRAHKLHPAVSATFNLLYGDPGTTPPEEFRLDLCAATSQEIVPNLQGVIGSVIPAGRCALLRYRGHEDDLGACILHLYAEWLPQSGETPRDFPLFLKRVTFFPDVPEGEAVTEIYLPLE